LPARRVEALIAGLSRHHGPHGLLAATWPTGSMVLWAVLLLGACLVFYYL
jgi:multicomponent Na+:H+ antiporter subunit D